MLEQAIKRCSCGSALPAAADPTQRSVQCPECGATHDLTASQTVVPTGVGREAPPISRIENSQRCAKCNTQLPPSADPTERFIACPACGHSNDLAAPAVTQAGGSLVRERGEEPDLTGRTLGGGRYKVEACIGRGGMGSVYRGTQVKLRRAVAIKFLSEALLRDEMFAKRFIREAETLATFDHPNIVNVIDSDIEGSLHYIVMRYVAGKGGGPKSLKELMEEGQLETGHILRLIAQCCSALAYAHEKHIIHRDIKPGNILIDGQGNGLIADFGIASTRGVSGQATLTVQGESMGTPDYMSPEQRNDPTKVDARSDLYSLGVVFYELLTGVLPRGHKSPPPGKVRSGLDPRVDAVVLKALHGDREQRYQTAAEMEEAVRGLMSGSSAAAGVKKGGIGKLAAAAAIVVALVAGGIWYSKRPPAGGGGGGSQVVDSGPTAAQLIDAVRERPVAEVEAILAKRPALVTELSGGQTALHEAAKRGDVEILSKLLASAADANGAANVRDAQNRTPLHSAAAAGMTRAAEKLLAAGADVTVEDNQGKRPFDAAAVRPYSELLDLLGPKEIVAAIGAKQTARVKTLLAIRPDLSIVKHGPQGDSLMHLAAAADDPATIDLLYDKQVSHSGRRLDGRTPLHSAAEANAVQATRQLLFKGADAVAKDSQNKMPTDLATAADVKKVLQNYEVVAAARIGDYDRIALALDADPALAKEKDRFGMTALHFAAQRGDVNIAQLVLAKGADVDAATVQGHTPLMMAVRMKRNNVARLLLDNKADPAKSNQDTGYNAMHEAAAADNVAMIKLLAERRKELVNAPTAAIKVAAVTGNSPLHVAGVLGNRDAVAALLELKADVTAKDSKERTPLQSVQDALMGPDLRPEMPGKRQAVVALLKPGEAAVTPNNVIPLPAAAGAGVFDKGRDGLERLKVAITADKAFVSNPVDKAGRLPLHVAAEKDNVEAIRLLLENGADIDALPKGQTKGRTALLEAVALSCMDAAQELLDRGANVNARDENGRTAAQLSKEQNNPAMDKLLARATGGRSGGAPARPADAPVGRPAGQGPVDGDAMPFVPRNASYAGKIDANRTLSITFIDGTPGKFRDPNDANPGEVRKVGDAFYLVFKEPPFKDPRLQKLEITRISPGARPTDPPVALGVKVGEREILFEMIDK